LSGEEQLLEQLERRLAELERANAVLSDAGYLAAHDLAEPARTVGGFAALLERRYRGRLDDEADEMLALIVDGARRMQALLAALGEVFAAERRPLRPEHVEPGVLVREAVQQMGSLLEQLRGEVVVAELPPVRGDRRLLAELFTRLLDNAVKFRGEGPPRVEVSGARGEGEVAYAVADRGIGIEPGEGGEVLRLFRRGQRAAEYAGAGAGLAVCERIAARHGGRIELAAREGGGAVARVRLPAR
jgi:light-regulated signal transduction histidine kinase (bacteriophytochrome)